MKKTKLLSLLAIGFLGLGALVACNPTPDPDPTPNPDPTPDPDPTPTVEKIKIGLHSNLGAGAGYSAINQGFFKEEGIEAEAVVGAGPALATQVMNGDIQISFMGGGVAYNYWAEDPQIKLVALDNLTDDDRLFANPAGPGKDLTLESSLEEIGNVAFGRANNIEAIHLPSTLKTIGINPFMGIVRIGNGTNNFTISENNPNFEIVDEVLFSKGENRELITYPYGKQGTTYVIPDGTTRLAEDSFVYILNLTDITIPVSVTDIHDAFRDMYSEIENDKPSLTVRYLGTKEQFGNINLNGNFGEWHQNTTIANNVVICSDGELTIV